MAVEVLPPQITTEFMQQVVVAGPKLGVEMFIGNDPGIRRFYENRTNGYAIEMLLNRTPPDADPYDWAVRVMRTKAAQSVVNRKAVVESSLVAQGEGLLRENPNRDLRFLSIASGWGRLPLDVMSALDRFYPGKVSAIFVDNNPKAIDASRDLAEQRGLGNQVETIEKSIFELRNAQLGPFDLIESTGLTDYLKDGLVVRLFKMCRNWVSDNGLVAITNIVSREEEDYLDIVWSKMFRRSEEEMLSFAEAADFRFGKTVLDPTETMCTIIARP